MNGFAVAKTVVMHDTFRFSTVAVVIGDGNATVADGVARMNRKILTTSVIFFLHTCGGKID